MIQIRQLKTFWLVAILVVLGLIGFALVLYSTRWGAALSDDSYYYIRPARDLVAGKGFDFVPDFAPFFSLFLGFFGFLGLDPLAGARWLNAALFGFNIALTGWLVYRMTRKPGFGILGALLILLSDVMIEAHSWAMSEPLYTALALLGIWLLVEYMQGDRLRTLVLAALFTGLAFFTRYPGLSLVFAGVLWLFIRRDRSWAERLRDTVLFGVISVLPAALWSARNLFLVGRPTSRVFLWNPAQGTLWRDLFHTMLVWFVPGRLVNNREGYWAIGLVILLLAGIVLTFIKYRKNLSGWFTTFEAAASGLFFLNILTGLFVLLVARYFFNQTPPIDDRHLMPVLLPLYLLLMVALASLWRIFKTPGRVILLGFCAVLVGVNAVKGVSLAVDFHENGRGYASARDSISETYAYLRKNNSIPVYSNAFTAIYFWTGRDTLPIPGKSGLVEMKEKMSTEGAWLVVFDSIPVEIYGVTPDELTNGLVEQIRLSESTIYRAP